MVKEVEKFKKKIQHKNVSATTKRSNITAFIAKQKSRQEFVPLVAELVDREHVEPLHLRNNACALAHCYLLNQAIEMTKPHLPSSFSQVSPDTSFFKFIDILRSKCNLNRLAKVIIKWYDDNANADTSTFNYRFTGKDSRMFLHNFMFLIDVLESGASGEMGKPRFHSGYYPAPGLGIIYSHIGFTSCGMRCHAVLYHPRLVVLC